MFPSFSNSQSTQVRSAYAEHVGQHGLLVSPQYRVYLSSKQYLLHCYFGIRVFLSGLGLYANKCSMSYGIIVVCFRRSVIKVVGVAANIVSAFMANMSIGRPVAIMKEECNPMRGHWMLPHQPKLNNRVNLFPLTQGRRFVPRPAIQNAFCFNHSVPKPFWGRCQHFFGSHVRSVFCDSFSGKRFSHGLPLLNRTFLVNENGGFI